MRAVAQRVLSASVSVDGRVCGKVGEGLLVYLGVERGDKNEDAAWLAEKIINLRIFADDEGKMNCSLLDMIKAGQDGAILAISQFTLLADARKGRRPSYANAEEGEPARQLYEHFTEKIRGEGVPCEEGVFQAHMKVESVNDGPVTILLDSRKLF
ncbi:D-aminoacyl-tRNA deacylase [Spirochaetia bacterium]|nr:D-aminoacyl-tRNA deacylase [Spirochaetia bacterium]